ncbi:hypothetical protein APHAL10511_006604 [Amanita phalloides]|nr:hypothetical protein APHAL10511_006604 [Amanita phalloides]
MDPAQRSAHEQDIKSVQLVLAKLCKIAHKTVNSTTILLPAWKAPLGELKLDIHLIPCNVTTRWNSTFDMLDMAIRYQLAIDLITQKRDPGLQDLELTSDEWKLAKQLQGILQILKEATIYFSCSTPSLATMIPAMDHINEVFLDYSINDRYHLAIHIAIGLAKKTLNRYYELTDSSKVYCITMILHPRHKLTYFCNTKWEPRWIETAEHLVQEEFEKYLANLEADDVQVIEEVQGGLGVKPTGNIFDGLAAFAPPK